jgi:stage III sporulation protein AD
MDILKVVGVGFLTLIISMVLKEYKKEYAIYASLIGGAILLLSSFETIKEIVNFLTKISEKTSYNSEFIKLLIKITGISILVEYMVSICKDCGETAIASKVDFAGKIIIISMSIPVISLSLTTLLNLLP